MKLPKVQIGDLLSSKLNLVNFSASIFGLIGFIAITYFLTDFFQASNSVAGPVTYEITEEPIPSESTALSPSPSNLPTQESLTTAFNFVLALDSASRDQIIDIWSPNSDINEAVIAVAAEFDSNPEMLQAAKNYVASGETYFDSTNKESSQDLQPSQNSQIYISGEENENSFDYDEENRVFWQNLIESQNTYGDSKINNSTSTYEYEQDDYQEEKIYGSGGYVGEYKETWYGSEYNDNSGYNSQTFDNTVGSTTYDNQGGTYNSYDDSLGTNVYGSDGYAGRVTQDSVGTYYNDSDGNSVSCYSNTVGTNCYNGL